MHVLFGALAGAGFALLAVAAIGLATGKGLSLKSLALAALGGAVAGAITTATLGASSTVGVGVVRQVVSFAAGGAAGGAVERVADNAIEDRPLHDGVVEATAVGGAVGVGSLGASSALRHVGARVFPALSRGAPTSTLGKLLGAATPGTGGGLLRGAGSLHGAGTGIWHSLGGGDPPEPAADAPGEDVDRGQGVEVDAAQAPRPPPPPPSQGMVGALR